MLNLLLCGYNLFCHIGNVNDTINPQRYPPDTAQLCTYFKEQKTQLPDYCFYKTEVKKPRHRNEY